MAQMSHQKSRSDWIKVIPGVVISLIAIGLIIAFIDIKSLIDAIQHANFIFLGCGILVSVTWLLIRTIVWRTLLENKPQYADVFFAVNEGYLLNNLLPFRLGEVGRAFLLGRRPLPNSTIADQFTELPPVSAESQSQDTPQPTANSLGFWRVLSSIVVERVLDMAFGVTALLLSLPFVINIPQAGTAAKTTGVIVVIGLVVLYLVGRFPQHVMNIFNRLTSRLGFIHRIGNSILPRLLDGLAVFKDWKRFLLAVFWMALNWLIAAGQYYLLIKAFIPEAAFLWALFTMGVVAVGGTIPSSPGNVGVLEGVIIAALSVFKIDASMGLAIGISIHLIQVIVTTVFGVYGLSREGETLMGVYQQLRTRDQNI